MLKGKKSVWGTLRCLLIVYIRWGLLMKWCMLGLDCFVEGMIEVEVFKCLGLLVYFN